MPHTDPLTDAELVEGLAALPGWTRDGQLIRRTVKAANFREAIALVNAVADAAEAANHHPDILISGYRNVRFELSTHATGSITRRDFELAAEIDRLAAIAAPTTI